MQNGRWISKRAQSLAYVFMTRDARVTVVSQNDAVAGLDFTIRVGVTARQLNWTVGVVVKGFDRAPTLNYRVELSEREAALIEQSPQPTFLLVLNVRDEWVYFAWIRRPGVDALSSKVQLTRIDDAQFKNVVDEVRACYRKHAVGSVT